MKIRFVSRICTCVFGSMLLATPLLAQGNGLLGGAGARPDQVIVVPPDYESTLVQPAYGGASQGVSILGIGEFSPPNNTITWSTVVSATTGISVFQTSAVQTDWWAPVHVPAGARVERIELEACDTTATGAVNFGMARLGSPGTGGSNVTAVGSTGTAATPGCAFFSVTPTSTLNVDNRNNFYYVFVDWSGDFTSANRATGFRIFYRLQVSAAPATATFADVPTSHPFFRFVEAMVAAGITGGCGPSLYCPDQPVTRGQMAVFMASALGLHFPF